METRYCPSCFHKLNESESTRLCPSCGFDFAAKPQPEAALPWSTLLHNRYIIGRVLGQGGFGITYIGFDTNLQCKVAIKEYYPRGVAVRDASQSYSLTWPTSQNAREKENGCESFLKEARKMARIGSIPGIVRVIDTFTENDTSYIIMDYLEGVTLRQYIKSNGPMSFSRCIEMIHPLFGAIDLMHRKGMIHRDISPDNIMVRGDGTVWLLDFGAAKDIAFGTGGDASAVVARSGFSPSEQYSGKNIGPWTDVYALCATMYYCVSGRTLPDVSERVQDDTIQWEPVQVPDDIQKTIREGLSMRYSDRIQSVSELLKRLDGTEINWDDGKDPKKDTSSDGHTELVDKTERDDGYSVSIDPITEETAKQKRKDLIKKAAIAAVAAVLLIGGAAFALSNTTSDDSEEAGNDEGTGVVDEENTTAEQVEEKVYRYADGGYGIYTGDWSDGHPNGSGTMTVVEEVPLSGGQSLQAGAVYTCETWEDGKMNGHGTAEFSDGGKYEGEWSDSAMEGQGVMTYAGGTVYDGEWVNGLRDGQGKITYSNGNTYEGGWKDDLRDGHGVVVRTNGETFEADWVMGEQVEDAPAETPEEAAPQASTQQTAPASNQQPASSSTQQSAPSSTQQPASSSTQQSAPSSAQQSSPASAPQTSSASDVAFGTCGTNLTWRLDSSGVLTISGSGDMTDYSYSSQAPWKDNRDSIVSVVIGNGVSSLGDYAFYYCKKMTNISISNTVTRIGDSTFQSTALSRISFPDSLRTIDSFAFYNCSSLTEVTIPANITNIESYAFDICTGLRSITVASGNANYCSENGVLYNKSKTELLRYPCNSGATSFTVPESVSSIDVGAFGNNQTLTSVTISGSKVNIWGFSFDKCVALRSVTVLGDVGNIGGNAFRGCSALTDLTFKGNAPTIRDTAFTDDTITISYPANNSTWAETIQDSYGGNITWRAS